jgi:hypothetical protein
MLKYLRLNRYFRNLGNRYGRSFWRLSSTLRRHIQWEANAPQLKRTTTWHFGPRESAPKLKLDSASQSPSFGIRLAASAFRTAQPFVCRLDAACLIGKFASPVTPDGSLIMSAFRDEPRMLGLEKHPELELWLSSRSKRMSDLPDLEHVWPMVNRLQSNYFHWLVEWCGRLELIEEYEASTGQKTKLLIPQNGPKYIRQSLELLGHGTESVIEWAENSGPRKVSELILPSFRGTTVSPSPAAMHWLRKKFMVATGAACGDAYRKLYISRPRGAWRSVINDDEVCDALVKDGFEIVQPQNLSLADQVRMFSSAALIVALHGSGLTNILFAPRASMLELFGSYGDGTWFGMTRRLGQQYDMLRCEPRGDDVLVDIENLRKRIANFSINQHRSFIIT